jgi:predicted nucleotidyltransferase
LYRVSDIQLTVESIASALPISRVTLVGSYAKNTATEQSDIDLVVDGADMSDSYWDFLCGREDAFSAKIDLLTARGLKNSCLRERILDGGIVLYEA